MGRKESNQTNKTICFKQHLNNFYYIKKIRRNLTLLQPPIAIETWHCSKNLLGLPSVSKTVWIQINCISQHLLQGLLTVVTGGHGLKNPTALKTLLSVSRQYLVRFPVSPRLLGTCGKCSEILNSSCLTKKKSINCTNPDQTASDKAV